MDNTHQSRISRYVCSVAAIPSHVCNGKSNCGAADPSHPVTTLILYAGIQQALNKYLAVKQDGRPVIEYIVEKEEYENTLGDIIRGPLKETSFREGLDGWLRGRLMVFRELPFKEYKDKAEVVDQEAKALKIGPYKPKNTEKRTNPSTSNSKQNQNSSKPKSNKDRDKPSKDQLKKEGKCYECLEKGHLAKDCPKKKKEKNEKEKDSKSTPESLETSAIRLTSPTISSKKDGRTYREVVSGQLESPKVPTISVVEKPEVTEKKPPPMTAMIPINGVPSKCLIDTGSSDCNSLRQTEFLFATVR